ncbi:MAG: hypothetical protein JWN52_6611 [Actinomycetia bacterium]|nr:hypothetical protein [Actinomycetes bacterium]
MDAETAAALRAPFSDELVGKRPQPTCPNCKNSPSKACDQHPKARCGECGQWMTTAHTHLDFVGHADTTDRFLSVDPDWSWEPVERQVDPQVLAAAVASGNPDVVKAVLDSSPPKFDANGGFWIRLTICGVTRLGYGDAGGKKGANAVKEAIGDALRNAGMRFGVALDMWRKESPDSEARQAPARQRTDRTWMADVQRRILVAESDQELLALSNEVDAKVHAGACGQAQYEQLRALGRNREAQLAAAATPPPDVRVPEPASPSAASDTGSEADPVTQFEAAIAAAETPEELGQVKAKVMADFKAQKFDPTVGNRLLREIKTRQTAIEADAA